MPVDVLAVLIIEGEDGEVAVFHEGLRKVNDLAVDFGGDGGLCEAGADLLGDLEGRSPLLHLFRICREVSGLESTHGNYLLPALLVLCGTAWRRYGLLIDDGGENAAGGRRSACVQVAKRPPATLPAAGAIK